MSRCHDHFEMTETKDTFQSWQGLKGPYFTPHIDELGNLTWTNNGDLANPPEVNIMGPAGQGLQITGIVESTDDLPESAELGTVFLVGTESPYEGYVFLGSWIDIGPLQVGPPGPQGEPGPQGDPGEDYVLTTEDKTEIAGIVIADAGIGDEPLDTEAETIKGAINELVDKKVDKITGKGLSENDYSNAEKQKVAQNAIDVNDLKTKVGSTALITIADNLSDGVNEVKNDANSLGSQLVTYVRPNLIDNWYFVGGGSQNGDGVFPINQRGQGSYEPNNSGTFLIDRWSTGRNTGKLQLHTASMSGTNDFLIEQSVGSIRDLGGKTLTISILTSQGLFSSTDACPTTAPTSGTTNLQAADIYRDGSRVGYADVIVNSAGNVRARIRVFDGYIAYFWAIKLELGDTQTLAHQEDGVWVLNEIPDYVVQMAKCQRYYQRYGNAQSYRVFAIGYMQNNTSARFFLPLSVPMARKPTVTVNGTLYFNYGASSNRVAITFNASAVNNWDDHQVFLAGTTASSVEVGTVGEIMSQNTTVESIELSAE